MSSQLFPPSRLRARRPGIEISTEARVILGFFGNSNISLYREFIGNIYREYPYLGGGNSNIFLGGGFNMFQLFFIFIPILGEMIQFDEHIFQMGWFNHQLVELFSPRKVGDESIAF